MTTTRPVRALALSCIAGLAMFHAPAVRAGGSPENMLLIINPANAQSMYLGNYYKNARNVPDSNVLYINPFASNYTEFAALNGNQDAVLGKIRSSRLDRQIDYILICDGSQFRISAPGLVNDGCSPVANISTSSAYTFNFINGRVFNPGNPLFITSGVGGISTNMVARYAFGSPVPLNPTAFTTATRWFAGAVSNAADAERYFMGAQLGYTGSGGNTVADILTMIDRSVAADGTRPVNGRVYYVNNTNDPNRNVRASAFATSVSALPAGVGQILSVADTASTMLPEGRNDAIGVMTGVAQPNIDGTAFTLLPGAFADHLTSYAADFTDTSQTKMSRWIAKGASGTSGTVEEPCNYPPKFVNPVVHVYINRGMSLGEAHLRSMPLLPFQSLFLGDPMTRPYATFPTISPNVPGGTASGTITFTSSASTSLAGASISSLELYVNGVKVQTVTPGQPFTLNTNAFPDGFADLRILAIDSTQVRNTGRWIGSININNAGRAATLSFNTTGGDLGTNFAANYTTGGGAVSEVRLLHNGRVLAASTNANGSLGVFGRQIGAGVSQLQIEALFADGRVARSTPQGVNVLFQGGTGSSAPVAQSYTLNVPRGGPIVVDLPAVFQDVFTQVNWNIVTAPNQATIGGATSPGRRGSVVITANQNASGTDVLRFEVSTPSGVSTGTVNIRYTPEIRTQFRFQ